MFLEIGKKNPKAFKNKQKANALIFLIHTQEITLLAAASS